MGETASIYKKLEKARQELLDLGLRNPLLNYRTLQARGLEIVREKPSEIYRILVAERRKMTFEATGSDDEDETLLLPPSVMEEKLLDAKLQTNYSEKHLERRLLNTYHSARTYIEEQGVNILYMALGMLHWYESDSVQEARRAPLILVPVQLDRVSARDRFRVSYTEEEIGHNISLQAKLKADFGLDLPGLPEDGELDADAYFEEVSLAVEGMKRWTVDRDALVIGLFSFGKFLMYRDLDLSTWPEFARPEEHPVMNALLGDGFREPPSSIAEEERLDEHVDLAEARHIKDADSSQMLAVLDANMGRNFVIQGPPGTGKSQTITNLIAEAIGHGKKVLFVSEKMAALEVVKRRLDEAGLGAACLELHSHKTNKKMLLGELSATLEMTKPQSSNDGDIRLLEDLRNRLNEYCDAVNTEIGETGVTPYDALGEIVRTQIERGKSEAYPMVSLPAMDRWTKDEYKKREVLIEELQQWIRTAGMPARHVFWGSSVGVVLPADIEALRGKATKAKELVGGLADALSAVSQALNIPAPKHMRDTELFLKALETAKNAPELKNTPIDSSLWTAETDRIEDCMKAGAAYAELRRKFSGILLPEAWREDVLETRQALVQYEDKWWKFLSGQYRKAKQRMLGLCKQPKDLKLSLVELADAIMESRRLEEQVNRHGALVGGLFPSDWRAMDSDWVRLSQLHQWILSLHAQIERGELPAWIIGFLNAKPERAFVGERLAELGNLAEEARRTVDSVEELVEYKASLPEAHSFQELTELMGRWAEQAAKLQEMASYNQLAAVCAEAELRPILTFAQDWEGAGEELTDCFRWNRYQALAARAFRERASLSGFDSGRHEHAIHKFRELDRNLYELNRFKLAELHWSRLPRHEAGGQLGVLRREFEKKTRHLPIRQLMSRAGHAIQAIKPVFMMGPLSISAYLQPGSIEFDLVIFDEASQVKPVDAFGAIIRAKQAIVVGDSKQMPPTNFFDTLAKEGDEEEDNFVADMESILGLFAGQNAPQRMLRWHYRSRHESLIAVSNYEFYDNRLVIFPSPDADRYDSGLICHYLPDTFYDRGRSRTNRLEARAVAEAVMEHARRRPHLTLGVAAFSMAQMQAVMDEVELLRRENPECEPFFAAHPHEPFFVKNLENVQGDERDVVFISIGYGKTKEGYLTMDFGPLNREGGERRLNVLITRARLRCEVFTNLRADDIDLNRTNARGVKALKTFLKYAESGLMDVPEESGRGFASPFEEAVHRRLTDLGYEVRTQVGSAGFFIDLAVVDPDAPGRYLLGIECDGATYHSARSARDRDRLRQQVLEGLGWTIHRIWSTDWFRHPERELKRIVEAIERAKLTGSAVPAAKLEQKSEPVPAPSASAPEETDGEVLKVSRLGEEPLKYAVAELEIDLGGAEFHALPASIVAGWVDQVVRVESPVHMGEVMKRICEAADIRRIGRRIQGVFEEAFGLLRDAELRGEFLWLKHMSVPPVRDRSELTAAHRKLDLLADEELAEAVVKAVRESFGAEESDAVQAAYRALGFVRVTEEMRSRLSALMEELAEQQKLACKNGIWMAE